MAFRRDDGYDIYMPVHDNLREYVVDRIVFAGLEENDEVLYKLRWFGYGPENDQLEIRENIPSNYINRYWSKISRMERDVKEGGSPAEN